MREIFDSQDEILIGDKKIGGSHPTYFIADVAANHDGDLERAKQLLRQQNSNQLNPNASVFFMPTKGGRKTSKKTKYINVNAY